MAQKTTSCSLLVALSALAGCLGLLRPIGAEELAGPALAAQLRHGGYVLVMRHTSSPATPPDKASADPANTRLERELDQAGREAAQALGTAIKRLRIPIGTIDVSPTFRAMQTVKLAGLGVAMPVPELIEGEQGMAADTNVTRATWLKAAATMEPSRGTNTLLVTHTPNIMAAFGAQADGIAAGETMVFHPDSKGGTTLVGRIKVDAWTTFPSP